MEIDIQAVGIVGVLGFLAYQLYKTSTIETSRVWTTPYDEKQYAPAEGESLTKQDPKPYYRPSIMRFQYDVSADAHKKSKTQMELTKDGVQKSGVYHGSDYADSTVYVNEY